MSNRLTRWFLAAFLGALWVALPPTAAWAQGDGGGRGRLVTVAWLQKAQQAEDVLVLDASPAQMYAASHIPGAVSADLYTYGIREISNAAMEKRLQSWGISPGRKVVVYEQGGAMMAPRLFFDLYYYGVPVENIFVLDGGLSQWQAAGAPVTKEATPAPAPGTFRVTTVKDDARVRLPEFLTASGDPVNNAVVEALEAQYHFGEAKFFDRAGHVPHGIMLPAEDFYNADKTFKSPQDIARMVGYLGIRPEQQVHTYCGGGVAASVPFFALKFILNYPRVKLYKESQMEYLQDDRGLPFWTDDAPFLKRDMAWLNGWGSRMMRLYGGARLNVVDVRPAEAYGQGHLPFALNIPAEVFKGALGNPAPLAALLGPAGVNADSEAVVVSDGGLNPRAALAFLMLERLGQQKVSVLMDSVDEWGLHGFPLTKEPTTVGPRKTPQDLAVPAVTYAAQPRPGAVMSRADASRETAPGAYPRVYIASGPAAPATAPPGTLVHVPYTELLGPGGVPKPAKDLWKILTKAGVPRYAELVAVSDDPGEAAATYFVLKMMGYPDAKVLLP